MDKLTIKNKTMDPYVIAQNAPVSEIVELLLGRGLSLGDLRNTGQFNINRQKEVREALWSKVTSTDTMEAYQLYLGCYEGDPHNQDHIEEAREGVAWCKAKQTDTPEAKDTDILKAYQDYLGQYEGTGDKDHIAEAKKRINEPVPNGGSPGDEPDEEEEIAELRKQLMDLQSGMKPSNDPVGECVKEINKAVNKDKTVSREEFLKMIKEDNNLLGADVVRKLIESNHLSGNDLKGIDIDKRFVKEVKSGQQAGRGAFANLGPVDKITNTPSTEVYFWGVPRSGKTCALGAILSVAGSGQVATTTILAGCQGYKYAIDLKKTFKPYENGGNQRVSSLPLSTPINASYEIGVTLEEGNRSHPLTIIDLAGECLVAMHHANSGIPLSNTEKNALDTVKNILLNQRSTNDKIHFFVIEYGAHDSIYGGVEQKDLLSGALQYITKLGIMEKDTVGINILITKADKAEVPKGKTLDDLLKDYTENPGYYKNFYNQLKNLCDKNEINKGIVPRFPFSLGKVCFRDYCLFDPAASESVLKYLLENSKGFKKKSWLK